MELMAGHDELFSAVFWSTPRLYVPTSGEVHWWGLRSGGVPSQT
jgi:hypothetical protein